MTDRHRESPNPLIVSHENSSMNSSGNGASEDFCFPPEAPESDHRRRPFGKIPDVTESSEDEFRPMRRLSGTHAHAPADVIVPKRSYAHTLNRRPTSNTNSNSISRREERPTSSEVEHKFGKVEPTAGSQSVDKRVPMGTPQESAISSEYNREGEDVKEGLVMKGYPTSPNPSGGKASCADPYDVFERQRRTEEEWVAKYKGYEYDEGERGGCCMQLGHTMLRVLRLMRQDLSGTICEFIIPIIFVVGSVILWAIFGKDSSETLHFLNETRATETLAQLDFLRGTMCANGTTIAGLPNCSLIPSKLYCPTGLGIPDGLCYSALLKGTTVGALSAFQGTTFAVPTLDQIIPLHWCNMDKALKKIVESLSNYKAIQGGSIIFTPDTAETADLVAYFRNQSTLFDNIYYGTMSVDAASKLVEESTIDDAPYWAIMQVNSLTVENFDVKIRLNSSAIPGTNRMTTRYYIGGLKKGSDDLYGASGFLTLQTMVYNYYATHILKNESLVTNFTYTPMPVQGYRAYSFIVYAGQLSPFIIVLGYLYPVSQMAKRIVLEKELRIREAMLIMGLSEVIMYLAWSIIYVVAYIIISLIMAILMQFTYLPQTSFGYLFFMTLFFSFSTITLSYAIASVFSKSRLAAILAPIIYFAMAIPLFAMQSASPSAQTGVMVLSPSAFAVGMNLLFDHELEGGAQAKDLQFVNDNPNLLVMFAMLFCDIIIYLLLTIYFDMVIPKDWGTSKNPLFFIIDPIKYCCCRNRHDDDEDLEDGRAPDGVFEPIEDEDSAPVKIRGLRKKFKRGGKSFLAVNNLYWSLKEGDISVLLGHNGAGKSTAMNLMTGMLAVDKGDCIIYGESIVHNKRGARQNIGLCPQHNILWPTLTVRQHLEYYAAIKGLKKRAREAAVKMLMECVDMEDKEDYPSKALSGGQKRKLSVGVAFVGGSRLVFLDEPTAGMDVGARRHTWGLLKKLSSRHTILLTTHFMDEADLLGNTMAIMSKGRMQCSGSNMFLKSKLGIGFILTMSVVAHVDRHPIADLVTRFVPKAESLGCGAGEVSYRLPADSKGTFPQLLTSIEDNDKSLGINAYSLSATTLEEIFLQIAEAEMEKEPDPATAAEGASVVWNVDIIESPVTRWFTQFRAMIIKRFWNAVRDARTIFFQLICPVVCVLLAMLLTLVKFGAHPDLVMTSEIYGVTVEEAMSGCSPYFSTAEPFSTNVRNVVWDNITTPSGFDSQLLDTYNVHVDERYSGIVCSPASVSVFFNSTATHEAPLTTASYYKRRIQTAIASPPSITMTVSTLPQTKQQEAVKSSLYALMIAVIIMIPFTFIPSTFTGWIVKERECKARHLQNVSGLSFYVYWISNLVFDFACYLISMFLVIAVFGIFNRKEYIQGENIGATIVLFLLYGISGIWMAYAISFAFNNHSSAQNTVMLVNFIVGFLLVLAVSALEFKDSTKKVANVLRWIFRIIPSYCVGEGISNLATLQLQKAYGSKKTSFSMDVIGWACVYMAIETPVFAFITLFVDHPGRRQRSQRLFHNPDAEPEELEDEDPDVVAERDSVNNDADRQNDLVRVQALRKKFPNGKVAVRNITFGVKSGEVFGFLGTNGAGKTTTISILCQEFYPTSGHASICGKDIVKESEDALRCIGYCPQFDACLDLLTVEEHLHLYAGVRGISSRTRNEVVEGLMKMCELRDYRKTKSHELSGGNRRKLSVAISLIGGPRVVFLDEPSAGMDPVARRGLWTAIQTVADNCSVVLTTHHLEEVEALAHRVAIMVDGVLHCIGNKTHLKQKFGTGFEVTVRVPDKAEDVVRLEEFFRKVFPSSELLETRSGRLTFELPATVRLSSVFTQLEENQRELNLIDYNVSQTSIEQVFLRISEVAEAQEEMELREKMENAKKKKCCSCCSCCK